MTETAETFADWLRDAHAMEKQALTMLSGQQARLEHYPDLRALISGMRARPKVRSTCFRAFSTVTVNRGH